MKGRTKMERASARRSVLLGAAALCLAPKAARAGERRIVSVGGAITEILYRLGREKEIVGVDVTSQFPPEALKTKPNVGYVRALGAEGVLSLKPSLVIAIEGAGPPDVLRLIEGAGVPVVRTPDDHSADGVVRRIEAVAEAIDAREAGARLVAEVKERFAQVAAARGAIVKPKRALFILSLQNGRPLVGGRGTTADGMLTFAGAVNAAAGLEGYKPLSDEGLIAAAPEEIVTMSRSHGPTPGDDLFARPAFAATPAARKGRVIVMDALYLLGFGPRTPQAVLDLMKEIYPETAPVGQGARR
jgi:iron complex transport system substrate-binding protein